MKQTLSRKKYTSIWGLIEMENIKWAPRRLSSFRRDQIDYFLCIPLPPPSPGTCMILKNKTTLPCQAGQLTESV